MPSTKKPLVGVSACLLGDAVRYDGKSKPNTLVLEQLNELFELVAVCPEVEAGLSVPRPPVQLTGSIGQPQLTGRDDPSINVTNIMHKYCVNKIPTLHHLKGFILKSRSPSCGLTSTPVFINGQNVTDNSRGVFARALCESYPNLPVIEDTDLDNPKTCQHFLDAVHLLNTSHNK